MKVNQVLFAISAFCSAVVFAAPGSASVTLTCDPDDCYFKCIDSGYHDEGGHCEGGNISGHCQCDGPITLSCDPDDCFFKCIDEGYTEQGGHCEGGTIDGFCQCDGPQTTLPQSTAA
ncbi:hypothetical protein D9756_001142 [Leucocoprinus leucothites]|uniref:Uncharacterized protein n=1 Tax=Leucocoprinus leucothites TaxID=201217 RepID=A0A8H5LN89_9AGAR|nr:hypothetical protein D9756_001142 [Leucoagaricus leucothites]